jgi:hypothetical protein
MQRNPGAHYNPNHDSPVNHPPGSSRNEDKLLPGKRLGLIPDQGLPRLRMPFRAAAIDIPQSDDHIVSVPAWNMGGNDRFGTCGPTSFSNYVTMAYWNLLQEPVTVTDDAVFDLYRASGNPQFNPTTDADDNGVDMVTLLNAAISNGIEITHADGTTEVVKAVCFGALDNSVEEIRAATAIFGGVELAVNLEVAQQQQLSTGVWDYQPSGSWGGHAIMGAAYTGSNDLHSADETIITWQKPVGLTDSFLQYQLSSSFAVVLPIHLTHPAFLAGVNVQQLATDYQELTGQTFPA